MANWKNFKYLSKIGNLSYIFKILQYHNNVKKRRKTLQCVLWEKLTLRLQTFFLNCVWHLTTRVCYNGENFKVNTKKENTNQEKLGLELTDFFF